MKGTRIVVPDKKCEAILKLIHEGHLGVNKCKLHAKETVYWPGLNDQLEKPVLNCEICPKILTFQTQAKTYLIFRSASTIICLDQASDRHIPL